MEAHSIGGNVVYVTTRWHELLTQYLKWTKKKSKSIDEIAQNLSREKGVCVYGVILTTQKEMD